jgi:exodeoxyribonuclease-3
MLVATYNVNSINARLDFVMDFLATHRPDLVCVQELKVDNEAFPHLAFAQAGYRAATHGQTQWNGVAVLGRIEALGGGEIEVVQAGLPGQDAAGARLLTVRALGLTITSVYVPNGKTVSHPDFRMKLAWLDALADHLHKTLDPSSDAVVGGDFNLVPEDIDSYAPAACAGHIFHTDGERARWTRILGAGLFDLFREKEPSLQAFSWWDYRAGAFHKKHGLRIDFLLGTRPILDRTTSVRIDRDFRKKRADRIPSDHAPVMVEIAPRVPGGTVA